MSTEIKIMEKKSDINIIKKKVPRRIVHFCDGSVPEYSSDEDEPRTDTSTSRNRIVSIDPVSLNWVEWIRFKSNEIGSATLNFCDYLGDSLSSFFGITTPKYQFEIDHYNMLKKMENENSDVEICAGDKIAGKSDLRSQ